MPFGQLRDVDIAFAFDDRIDRPGGVQTYILTFARWLRDQGHSVSVLSAGRLDLPGVTHWRVPGTPQFGLNGSSASLALPFDASAFYRGLKNNSYDVLHVIHPQMLGASGRAMIQVGDRTAVAATSVALPVSRRNHRLNLLLARLIRAHTRRVDIFLPVSKVAQAALDSNYGAVGRVLPPPVEATKYPIRRGPAETSAVLSIGMLSPRKNQAELIRAMSSVKRDHAGTRLFLIGDGPSRQRLERLTQELDLGETVSFLGWVDDDEKKAALASARVGVFPASGGESFGCVLVEAMLSGTPIVAAANDGYRETLRGADALLVERPDATHLASAILRAMEAGAEAGRANRVLAEQYDVNVVGPRLIEAYEWALTRRAKPMGHSGPSHAQEA